MQFNEEMQCTSLFIHSFIHSFIPAISIAPLQVHYYSEAISAQILLSEFPAEAPMATTSEGLTKYPT